MLVGSSLVSCVLLLEGSAVEVGLDSVDSAVVLSVAALPVGDLLVEFVSVGVVSVDIEWDELEEVVDEVVDVEVEVEVSSSFPLAAPSFSNGVDEVGRVGVSVVGS